LRRTQTEAFNYPANCSKARHIFPAEPENLLARAIQLIRASRSPIVAGGGVLYSERTMRWRTSQQLLVRSADAGGQRFPPCNHP
jgi:TPP-dependent trihydroxycyclohexane-1,2-dione (THcHDO) dehydratase